MNDFRKLCAFEAYAPTDNVSELTARVNDEGWDTSFSEWLKVSRLGPADAVLVFSVGGGSKEKNVSANLVLALERRQVGWREGVRHRRQGRRAHARVADACVIDSDRLARPHHPAHRGDVRGGLASPRHAPRAEAGRHQVGIRQVGTRPGGRRWLRLLLAALPPVVLFALFVVTGFRGIDFGYHWDEVDWQLKPVQEMVQTGLLMPRAAIYPAFAKWLILWPALLRGRREDARGRVSSRASSRAR